MIGEETVYDKEYKLDLQSTSNEVVVLESCIVKLDTKLSEDLIQEGIANELIRNIQECRKQANLDISDRIYLEIISLESSGNSILDTVKNQYKSYIEKTTLSQLINNMIEVNYSKQVNVNDIRMKVSISKM